MFNNIYGFSLVLLRMPCIKLKYVHLAQYCSQISKRMKGRKERRKEGRKEGGKEKREENPAKVEFSLSSFYLLMISY